MDGGKGHGVLAVLGGGTGVQLDLCDSHPRLGGRVPGIVGRVRAKDTHIGDLHRQRRDRVVDVMIGCDLLQGLGTSPIIARVRTDRRPPRFKLIVLIVDVGVDKGKRQLAAARLIFALKGQTAVLYVAGEGGKVSVVGTVALISRTDG